MGVSLGPFEWEPTAADEQERHRECRHCGRNLPASVPECRNCGGTPVAYDVR